MPEPAPGHVSDVEQAVHAIEVDERAEVGQIFHRALHLVPYVHPIEEFLPFLAALLLDQLTPAEHNIAAVIVDLDDFEIVSVADELLQIFRRGDVDLRRREKNFENHGYPQPPLFDRPSPSFV